MDKFKSGATDIVFFVLSLQGCTSKTLNATFPFPQVFGLRRLRGNPPCSLWLQSVHWTNCFTRRAHITVPPCREPTVTAWRGDNSTRLTQSVTIAIPSLRSLRSRHNHRHFSYYATSLCVSATQQHGAVARTAHTRAHTRQKQANLCVTQARRLFARRRCGSCSVFEVAHSVNKCAPNMFSFRAQQHTLSLRATAWQSRGNETTNFFCARATIINYSLFITNY